MIQSIATKIKNLPKNSIIIISGFGGSGKSTLAHEIAKLVPSQIIAIDDFFRDLPTYNLWECYDFERFIKEIITPYKNHTSHIYYAYNWEDPSSPITKELKISDYLIIEGVGLFRDQLYSIADFSIWVDCPIELANHRGKTRDKNVYGVDFDAEWDGIWKKNDLESFTTFKPLQKADVVYASHPQKKTE